MIFSFNYSIWNLLSIETLLNLLELLISPCHSSKRCFLLLEYVSCLSCSESRTRLLIFQSFVQIAPLVNHVALSDVSDELLAFSKVRNIELRARPSSDSDVDLSGIAADSWSVSWALRYSVTAKHQHLLLTKGYLFECMQENKKTTETLDASPNPIVLSH